MRFLAEFFSNVCPKHMTVMSVSIIFGSRSWDDQAIKGFCDSFTREKGSSRYLPSTFFGPGDYSGKGGVGPKEFREG